MYFASFCFYRKFVKVSVFLYLFQIIFSKNRYLWITFFFWIFEVEIVIPLLSDDSVYKLVPGQNKCILFLYAKHMVQILMWTNTKLDFFDQFAHICLKWIIFMNLPQNTFTVTRMYGLGLIHLPPLWYQAFCNMQQIGNHCTTILVENKHKLSEFIKNIKQIFTQNLLQCLPTSYSNHWPRRKCSKPNETWNHLHHCSCTNNLVDLLLL